MSVPSVLSRHFLKQGWGKCVVECPSRRRKVRCEVDERSAVTGLDCNCECECNCNCGRPGTKSRARLPGSKDRALVESLCPAKLPSC